MIVGVLQARYSSSRLPGKVLAPLLGQPMILRQTERLARSKKLDRLVVATSTEHADDGLANICADAGLETFRGSLDDVLNRVLNAASEASHIVRLTADCPLTDPSIIDLTIMKHLKGEFDYTSNTVKRTYPDGLDVEVVRHQALATAARQARLPYQREHVTPFLYQNPDRFRIGYVTARSNLSHLRWTVDTQEDLAFVREVYQALYPRNKAFTTEDVLKLLGSSLPC